MQTKEILLIDDDQDDIKNFMDAIESLPKKIHCRSSDNPVEILEELASAPILPDLILLDYNMPYINGMEFLRKLKSYNHLTDVEVVMFSTPDENVMLPWLEKNNIAVKYISKPDTFEELRTLFDAIL